MTDNYKDKTDDELILMAKGMYWQIETVECSSVHDLHEFECVRDALTLRGYKEVTSVDYIKEDNDEEDELV